jgi:ankyrin repeat protein
MFQYLRKKLKSSTSAWHLPWKDKQTNLALMRTFDNQTPLVFAMCHPEITEDIIKILLNEMSNNSKDFFTRLPSESNIYQTQIFIAFERMARQQFQTGDHLQPVLEICNMNMFNQLCHFPCRYDNVSLLKWLVEQSSKFNDIPTADTRKSAKVDLNTCDHAGYTPLLTAVFYKATKCVKYLLQVRICLQNICNYCADQFDFVVFKS